MFFMSTYFSLASFNTPIFDGPLYIIFMKYLQLTYFFLYADISIENFCGKRKIELYLLLQKYKCDHYSRAVLFIWLECDYYSREETIQGRKLLIIRRFLLRKLFIGGKYSREEIIRWNTVFHIVWAKRRSH